MIDAQGEARIPMQHYLDLLEEAALARLQREEMQAKSEQIGLFLSDIIKEKGVYDAIETFNARSTDCLILVEEGGKVWIQLNTNEA